MSDLRNTTENKEDISSGNRSKNSKRYDTPNEVLLPYNGARNETFFSARRFSKKNDCANYKTNVHRLTMATSDKKNHKTELGKALSNKLKDSDLDFSQHDLLLSALPHPIIVLDRENHFVYANGPAEVFLCTSIAHLRRTTLDSVLAFGSPLISLVDQIRRREATVNGYGVEVMTPRFESAKNVDVYGGLLGDQHKFVMLMLLQRDVAQMIERQMTHRAAARSVSGMAAVLAHEIKNPLSGIRGAAQLLEHNLSDEDRALTQLICTETERIRKLVDRMEVFGDERPIPKESVNVHNVLDYVRQVAEAGFARHVKIVENYDPSLPPVQANRDQLIQAFLNLVKNAAEAVDRHVKTPRIAIRTAFRPGVRLALSGPGSRASLPLMIEIQDNGAGIPEHLQPHLFDPFVSTKHNGTGLGLALVAKIIGDHGGVVEFESEPGRTVFRILLPLQETVKLGQPD